MGLWRAWCEVRFLAVFGGWLIARGCVFGVALGRVVFVGSGLWLDSFLGLLQCSF